METKEPDSEEVTIEDMMRVAGWKQAYNQGQRHFHEQRHTRSMMNWFNSCRFFAPYYEINRLFKFDGPSPPGPEPKATAPSLRAWEEAFLTLTTNHFFKGTLYVTKPPIYRLWRWRKNLSVPLGVNIFGIFWKWYGSNYQSLTILF